MGLIGPGEIIPFGTFIQAGFAIFLAFLLVIGALCVLWRWRNNLPTYQCRKCSGVFQTMNPTPMCPFCGGMNLYLRDLGGD